MKKQLTNEEYIKSSDLPLVAVLCYFDHLIDDIDKSNRAKAVFFIQKNDNSDDLIQKFWRHELKVEPVAFFNLIRTIKSQLYDN